MLVRVIVSKKVKGSVSYLAGVTDKSQAEILGLICDWLVDSYELLELLAIVEGKADKPKAMVTVVNSEGVEEAF